MGGGGEGLIAGPSPRSALELLKQYKTNFSFSIYFQSEKSKNPADAK